MRVIALLAVALAAFLPRALAQTSLPDLGGAGETTISPQVERRIGESIMREIRASDPAYMDDPEVARYLDGLGRRLLSAVPDARQDFEFFGMRDASINAFALPGGFIGVNSGLLTVYDMLKAVDRGMVLTDLRLEEKRGGRSGTWRRPPGRG